VPDPWRRKENVPNTEAMRMEEVLGFCALVLTMLMMLGITVWFCCSAVECVIKTRRGLKKPRYSTLLRENERLKSILADVAQEHHLKEHHLRKIHRSEIIRRKSNRLRQKAA
jgi:hypothetical protein